MILYSCAFWAGLVNCLIICNHRMLFQGLIQNVLFFMHQNFDMQLVKYRVLLVDQTMLG